MDNKKNKTITKQNIKKKSNTTNKKKSNTKTKTTKTTKKKVNTPNKKNNTLKEKQVAKNEVVIEKTIDKPKKEHKYNKNMILSILASLVLIIGLSSIILLKYPIIKENIEIKLLNKEVNNILKDNNKIEDALKDNITSGELTNLENKVEQYLLDNINLKNELLEIKKDNVINNSLTYEYIGKDEVLNSYDNILSNIETLENKVNDLRTNNNYKDNNKKYEKEYNKISNIIEGNISFDDINTLKDKLNDTKPLVKYLIENKTSYKLDEEKITFLKRNKKEEYDSLLNNYECKDCNIIKYELIEDKEGPVINASNITITKGTKLDIKSKVSCNDAVDDKTECVISGTFDSSKVGTYKITITSKDKSNNSSSKSINVIVKEKTISNTVNSNKKYYIEVIRNQNVVIVYGKDGNNQYNKVVKVFVASVGRSGKTPTGTFKTTRGYQWGGLIGGVWGQYTTRITGSYLFHSVPYYSKNKGDLEWQEYNKLGTAASAGCVRLAVRDAKWIYDNIENGTTVKIYDGSLPSGITKPTAKKISSSSPNKGWDPTDPDPNNPWNK